MPSQVMGIVTVGVPVNCPSTLILESGGNLLKESGQTIKVGALSDETADDLNGSDLFYIVSGGVSKSVAWTTLKEII